MNGVKTKSLLEAFFGNKQNKKTEIGFVKKSGLISKSKGKTTKKADIFKNLLQKTEKKLQKIRTGTDKSEKIKLLNKLEKEFRTELKQFKEEFSVKTESSESLDQTSERISIVEEFESKNENESNDLKFLISKDIKKGEKTIEKELALKKTDDKIEEKNSVFNFDEVAGNYNLNSLKFESNEDEMELKSETKDLSLEEGGLASAVRVRKGDVFSKGIKKEKKVLVENSKKESGKLPEKVSEVDNNKTLKSKIKTEKKYLEVKEKNNKLSLDGKVNFPKEKDFDISVEKADAANENVETVSEEDIKIKTDFIKENYISKEDTYFEKDLEKTKLQKSTGSEKAGSKKSENLKEFSYSELKEEESGKIEILINDKKPLEKHKNDYLKTEEKRPDETEVLIKNSEVVENLSKLKKAENPISDITLKHSEKIDTDKKIRVESKDKGKKLLENLDKEEFENPTLKTEETDKLSLKKELSLNNEVKSEKALAGEKEIKKPLVQDKSELKINSNDLESLQVNNEEKTELKSELIIKGNKKEMKNSDSSFESVKNEELKVENTSDDFRIEKTEDKEAVKFFTTERKEQNAHENQEVNISENRIKNEDDLESSEVRKEIKKVDFTDLKIDKEDKVEVELEETSLLDSKIDLEKNSLLAEKKELKSKENIDLVSVKNRGDNDFIVESSVKIGNTKLDNSSKDNAKEEIFAEMTKIPEKKTDLYKKEIKAPVNLDERKEAKQEVKQEVKQDKIPKISDDIKNNSQEKKVVIKTEQVEYEKLKVDDIQDLKVKRDESDFIISIEDKDSSDLEMEDMKSLKVEDIRSYEGVNNIQRKTGFKKSVKNSERKITERLSENKVQNTDVESKIKTLEKTVLLKSEDLKTDSKKIKTDSKKNTEEKTNDFISKGVKKYGFKKMETKVELKEEVNLNLNTSGTNKIENFDFVKELDAVKGSETVYETVFSQVEEGIKVNFNPELNEMKIKLTPEDLGDVEVKVQIENSIMKAEFTVENEKVREILESKISDLKQALSEKGIETSEINVNISNGGNYKEKDDSREEISFFDKKIKTGSLEDQENTENILVRSKAYNSNQNGSLNLLI